MPDPLLTLASRFSDAIAAAFGADHAGTDPVVRRSDRADYQANAAMALAKKLGQSPRDVAAAILEHLAVDDLAERTEIAGPGFINVWLRTSFLSETIREVAADERLGVPASGADTVVIDYSHPNVAKEMHVGHLRSTIIGDAIVRVLDFLGHRVIRHNHIGDWGTPFGMLIEHLLDIGEQEAAHELSVGDLTAFYQQAREKFDGDPSFADRARARVVTLQAGDPETLRLWRLLVDESTRYFQSVYDRLDVTLTPDDLVGESFYNPWLDEVAAELEKQGIARIDDGALCAFPPGFTGRDGDPLPLIVRKRDGGYGYQATDLAAVRYRVGELGGNRLVYVVDAGQGQHLNMVFAVAREAGWMGDARAEHAVFGLVLGPDKKRFRTRSGDNVKLIDLLDEAVERAAAVVRDKNPDLAEGEQRDVAHLVGMGALKYADLANDRIKDYVFDWDRMLAFEGNTGPYLQYAHARIRSIFRRSEGLAADPAAITLVEDAERALAVELLGFGAAVESVAESLQPHRLTTYLFTVASAFTTFYEQCPILKAESAEVRASRLALADVTARVLAKGLDLLGIIAPDRM